MPFGGDTWSPAELVERPEAMVRCRSRRIRAMSSNAALKDQFQTKISSQPVPVQLPRERSDSEHFRKL